MDSSNSVDIESNHIKIAWNPQYKALDYCRGIAALWVMLFHGFGIFYDTSLHPITELIKRIAQPGWLGVHLFFVISGYCIAASVYRALQKDRADPRKFLLSRAQRLLPVYWLAFLTSIAINLFASPFNSTGLLENFPESWQSWLGNILLIQPYVNTPYYVVVYWSLVVEIGFYVLVATFLLFNQIFGSRLTVVATVGLSIVAVFIPADFNVQTLTFWDEFFCGVLTFSALLGAHTKDSYLRNASLLLLGIFLVQGAQTHFSVEDDQLWLSASFAILLYFVYPLDKVISNIPGLDWLRVCGAMSYSLYLLHIPLQSKIVNLSIKFVNPDSLLTLPVQILGWMIAISGSYIFFCTVEKPLNDWRQRSKLPQSKSAQ